MSVSPGVLDTSLFVLISMMIQVVLRPLIILSNIFEIDVESNKEKLPKIETRISRKFQKKILLSDGTFNKFFEIKVSLNKQPLSKINHSLDEFISLANELKYIYTSTKFKTLTMSPPTLDVWSLRDLWVQGDMSSLLSVIETLDEFLEKICEDPCFMHETVLDFLNIPHKYRSGFIKFIDYAQLMSSKMSPSRMKLMNQSSVELKDISMVQSERSSIVPNAQKTVDKKACQAVHLEVQKVNFGYSKAKNEILYIFEIKMTREDKTISTWNIAKSYRTIRLNNQRMKIESDIQVPSLQDFVPSAISGIGENALIHNQKMQIGLERYLKTVFSIKSLYYPYLFEFLCIDPLTLEVSEESLNDSVPNMLKREEINIV